jgi:hypothetical protein
MPVRITQTMLDEIENLNYSYFMMAIIRSVYIETHENSGCLVIEINQIKCKKYFKQLDESKIKMYLEKARKEGKHIIGGPKHKSTTSSNLKTYISTVNTASNNPSTHDDTNDTAVRRIPSPVTRHEPSPVNNTLVVDLNSSEEKLCLF